MMTATVSSQWKGNEVKIAGKRVIGKSIYEIGLVVEGQAKALTPVDTGRLRGSITTASVDKQTSPQYPSGSMDSIRRPNDSNEVLVGTAVEYGPYIEFGTVRSSAQPFLRPSLDLAKGKTLTIMEKNGRMEFKEYMK